MEKNRQKNGSSAFFWGLIVGAILASLLTTKKGRKILRELIDVGLEMLEDFAQQKKVTDIPVVAKVKNTVDEIKQEIREEKAEKEAKEDIDSEIGGFEEMVEEEEQEQMSSLVQMMSEDEVEVEVTESESKPTKSNGHSKKRLFRGIRKAK